MPEDLVLTIIARDRPGVVEDIARVVSDHSGNWIDSALSRLGGEFTGILRITVPEHNTEPLIRALEGLAARGITVAWRADEDTPPVSGTRARLTFAGRDHADIVHDVCHVLASRKVNVENLRSEVIPATADADPVFSATAEVILPTDLDVDDLRDALELAGNANHVEIVLKENG